MNQNFSKFIKDIDTMNKDRQDSITYNTLKTLADRIMLDELLCGEGGPVDFLIETLQGMRIDYIRDYHISRLKQLKEEQL